MNRSGGQTRRSDPTTDLSQAVDAARLSREADCGSQSDSNLEAFLYSTAGSLSEHHSDERVADALGAVSTAIRRRLGIWRAATWEVDDLSGTIRHVREQAEQALKREILSEGRHFSEFVGATASRELADLLSRLRIEHPSEVRLPADFYELLEAVDDSRCLRFSPTEQQLTAAALLMHGVIVEMDAGEGKTLASAIAAAALAASGRRVHILTANDYLAARDCEVLAPVLESLGLTVGLVVDGMDRADRQFQYAAQIVFTTAREVGFDYLRDSVAESLDQRVNPTFDVAIVDEADHLLVDQARTPLIISGDRVPEPTLGVDAETLAEELLEKQAGYLEDLYAGLNSVSDDLHKTLATLLLAGGLTPRLVSELDRLDISTRRVFSDLSRMNDEDEGRSLEAHLLFAIDPDRSTLRLTETGWEEVYTLVDSPVSAFGTVQALSARVLHDPGTDYVLDEGGVTLVDRLDGRPMFSHRYMLGLHEALESKEGLSRQSRTDAKARTTIRALMSNYKTIGGLTGTAMEAADAFARDYGVQTVRVPPEFESRRVDLGAEVFFSKDEHLSRVVDEVSHWHNLGRPVLVTTGSVTESSALSAGLTERSIPHDLLNAERAESESDVVARGGEFGAVTVSTGMAGRGTDFVVEHEVDSRVTTRAVTCAQRILDCGRAASFVCASDDEAELLARALNDAACGDTSLRNSQSGYVVTVGPLSSDPNREVQLPFGLGLIVIITSLPGSARAERQIRGRTGRQGSFGASKVAVYVNDPALAFSVRQSDIPRFSTSSCGTAEGPEVGRTLKQIQSDADSQSAAAALAMAEYEAVVESESRAHYEARVDLMGSYQSQDVPERIVSNWVMRRTVELEDIRVDYETRFAIVSDSLWHSYGIDVGAFAHMAPAAIRVELELEVHRRLSIHRDRLGAKRFALAVAQCRLKAADAEWPTRLADMQEMILTFALGASSRHAAVTELAEQIIGTRNEFWARADDDALRSMLDSGHVAERDLMGENRIEQLPDELEALLR